MKEEKSSSFRFNQFKIRNSSFEYSSAASKDDLKVLINPSGEYDQSTNIFKLLLNVIIRDSFETELISILSESSFEFDEEIENGEIPGYFTLNAPALTFPFVRAYIIALSSLSGFGTIEVPILNLVDLAKRLKKNIKIIGKPSE